MLHSRPRIESDFVILLCGGAMETILFKTNVFIFHSAIR